MHRAQRVHTVFVAFLAIIAMALVNAAGAHAESAKLRSELVQISSGGASQSDNAWEPALGAHADKPKGWIMLIHGGGWVTSGAAVVNATLSSVQSLRENGWAVYNVDYGTGTTGLPDVVADYETMRATLGSKAPICVLGQSAGAHLALLLAAREPSVNCVISEAALDDLQTLPNQLAYPLPGESASYGPQYTYNNLIVPAFGSDPTTLAEWSPVNYVSSIHAHMLLGGSSYDWVVPEKAQLAEMTAHAAPGMLKTMLLAGEPTADGDAPNFVHASITPAATAKWLDAELQLLDWESGSSSQAFTN